MAKSQKEQIDNLNETVKFLYAGGAIVNLSENPRLVEKTSTGRPTMDFLTDGGFPKGRMILIAGAPSAGKSSLTIQISDIIGKKILYLDTEATLTTDYIEQLGADPSKFFHAIPESTEQMCNIIRKEIKNFDVIIVDSINNSSSIEQLQKNAEDRTMANRAITMASQLPIIISLCNQYDTTLIVLSQIRDNMNKVNNYSPDTVIPGGKSLHHNSSMTIELTPSTKKKAKDSDELDLYDTITGRMIRMTCSKNKVGKPFRTVELEFSYGRGYTPEADIASAALRLGVLQKAGGWIKYKGATVAQGLDNLVATLFDNPELTEELMKEVTNLIEQQETEDEK